MFEFVEIALLGLFSAIIVMAHVAQAYRGK